MLQDFNRHIKTQLPMLTHAKVLIACSGGVDSMVLSALCALSKINQGIAHCNFGLRGKESDEDENFVKDYAAHLGIPFFHTRFETEVYAKQHQLSIQMAARTLRYEWFKELAITYQYDYVLTAHHADDVVETFFINLSRGTGIEGLLGIPEINGIYIRPLLPFSRVTIENFAKAHTIAWREDSSNHSTKYLRNQIRHEVIPALKKTQPQFLERFQATQSYLQQSNTLLTDMVNQLRTTVFQEVGGETLKMDLKILDDYTNPKAVLYHLFKAYGFTAWEDIEKLCTAQAGKQVFSETHRLLKDRGCLYLTPQLETNTINARYTLPEGEEVLMLTEGFLKIETVHEYTASDTMTIYVDKTALTFPLTVRKKKEGDYFYPIGMKGKKKLSKYCKDEKLSLFAKEKVWLLCTDEAIVWVIGYRADERFKVTSASKQILKITFHYEL